MNSCLHCPGEVFVKVRQLCKAHYGRWKYSQDSARYVSYSVKNQRTEKGYASKIYSKMKSRVVGTNSKSREYPHLWLGKTLLPKADFIVWSLSDPKYLTLFAQWTESGFDPKKSPSIDRIDDSLGYELGNMQWLTKVENSTKGARKPRVRRWKKKPEGYYLPGSKNNG